MIINMLRILIAALLVGACVSSEGASKEYCYSNYLDHNPHTRKCCDQGQIYASGSKRCCPEDLYQEALRTCSTPTSVKRSPVRGGVRVRRGPALLPKKHKTSDFELNKKRHEL